MFLSPHQSSRCTVHRYSQRSCFTLFIFRGKMRALHGSVSACPSMAKTLRPQHLGRVLSGQIVEPQTQKPEKSPLVEKSQSCQRVHSRQLSSLANNTFDAGEQTRCWQSRLISPVQLPKMIEDAAVKFLTALVKTSEEAGPGGRRGCKGCRGWSNWTAPGSAAKSCCRRTHVVDIGTEALSNASKTRHARRTASPVVALANQIAESTFSEAAP